MERLKAGAKIAPVAKRSNRGGLKRSAGLGVTLAVLLLAVAFIATRHMQASHAAGYDYHQNNVATTINALHTISQVGSTATIVGVNGQNTMVDPNPYKIAIAPMNVPGWWRAGDLIVSNIGNNDHGMTLVKFVQQRGPGRLFNKMNLGVLGPAGLAFDTRSGALWVANSTGNDVLVFNPNGTVITIQSPLFNGPWGITTNSSNRSAKMSFFVSNKFDARILRIDIIPQGHALPRFKVVQIGQFDKMPDATKIDLHWLPQLNLRGHIWNDVLLAIDPTNNRIAAFANSSAIAGQGKGVTVFQGKPLNTPGGFAINPLNGDLLVVNLADNNLVELNMTWGKVVGVKQIDPAKVDNQGNGSALFGVVAIKDNRGNLKVFFTDDNTNTLDALSAS